MGTEVTIMMLFLKTHTLPYSAWQFGCHEKTMSCDTNTWLSSVRQDETRPLDTEQFIFWQRLQSQQHHFSQLSLKDTQCLVALYQYQQWMAQFDEEKTHIQPTLEKSQCVFYIEQLLLCSERYCRDNMLCILKSQDLSFRPIINFTDNIAVFLYIIYRIMLLLVGPVWFDSVKSAADVLWQTHTHTHTHSR